MREHAKGHGAGPAAKHAEPAKAAPGRTTQHERGEPGAKHRASGSVFDAFRAPALANAADADGSNDHDKHDGDHDGKNKKHDKHDHDDAHGAHAKGEDDGKQRGDDDVDDDMAYLSSAGGHDKGDEKKAEATAKEHGGSKSQKSGGPEIHIITRAGLRHLREAGREGRHAARVLYNNPNAYIVLKEGQTIPKGWKANSTILFPSYAEFEAAHNAGRVPRGTDAVVYDNEHWAQTPHEEKTHAMKYARKFGELADKLGLVYIAAPTRKWFAADARYADIIDVQLQSREVHMKSYLKTLRSDANLARKLNPDILITAQISSNRNHLDPDHSGNIDDGITKVEKEILESAGFVDGFWGYLYQQNKRSIRAGQRILIDLARKHEKGAQI